MPGNATFFRLLEPDLIIKQPNQVRSADIRNRIYDNILMERAWRTGRDEGNCIEKWGAAADVFTDLSDYFEMDDYKRWEQSFDYNSPTEVHFVIKQLECQNNSRR